MQKEQRKSTGDLPVAVDLFAGAGGFSLAAIQSGFSIDFAIENDKFAVQTYEKNISPMIGGNNPAILKKSIIDYDPEQIRKERFCEQTCDLLLGGPPCQGFSTHRILDAGVGDPRNNLILAYFKFVKALQPKVFLMENVPGMLWYRHVPYLRKLYKQGSRAGYHLFEPYVLDARDFGVPQRRKRVFILGMRDKSAIEKIHWPPNPTHRGPNNVESGLLPWRSCEHVFRPAPDDDGNDIHMNHGAELEEAFKSTPPNGGSRKDSGRLLACHANHDGHKDVYGRIDPSKPAPTMTTACINPSKGRFVHPTEHHGITLRQAARIQTFPDTFTFVGGLTAAGKQIGNAVPVDMGKHLIQHIKMHLINENHELRERSKAMPQKEYGVGIAC